MSAGHIFHISYTFSSQINPLFSLLWACYFEIVRSAFASSSYEFTLQMGMKLPQSLYSLHSKWQFQSTHSFSKWMGGLEWWNTMKHTLIQLATTLCFLSFLLEEISIYRVKCRTEVFFLIKKSFSVGHRIMELWNTIIGDRLKLIAKFNPLSARAFFWPLF